MAHRRIKDISYDDSEIEDYDDPLDDATEPLSPEDQEQMRTYVPQVRSGLGDIADFTTEKEIQDALWYYYYDVEKSVVYLRKQKRPDQEKESASKGRTPKKEKVGGRFEEAAKKVEGVGNGVFGDYGSLPLWSCTRSVPHDFFADTPFLAVPEFRLGTLTAPIRNHTPRGGLLGGSSNATSGSGKPSKLAALAASRKKAAEEKRKAESGAGEKVEDISDSSLRLLDRLGKRQKTGSEVEKVDVEGTRSAVEGLKLDPSQALGSQADVNMRDAPTAGEQVKTQPKRIYPRREQPKREASGPAPVDEAEEVTEEAEAPSPEVESLQGAPSHFASSLFSSKPDSTIQPRAADSNLFTLPPPTLTGDQEETANPFSGPSPDDIVIRAQQGKGPQPKPKR